MKIERVTIGILDRYSFVKQYLISDKLPADFDWDALQPECYISLMEELSGKKIPDDIREKYFDLYERLMTDGETNEEDVELFRGILEKLDITIEDKVISSGEEFEKYLKLTRNKDCLVVVDVQRSHCVGISENRPGDYEIIGMVGENMSLRNNWSPKSIFDRMLYKDNGKSIVTVMKKN